MTRSSGWSAIVVARGPNFFNLLLRKAGGWIVSRRLRTAWMEGMLAAPAASSRAACYGGGLLPLFFVGSPPLVDATRVSRRAATPPDVTPPGVPQNWRRAGSAAFCSPCETPRPGLKRRAGGPLQACGRGHASRATPSRGLASPRLAEALASHQGRAAWALAVRRARSGRRAARSPQILTIVETTPPAHL